MSCPRCGSSNTRTYMDIDQRTEYTCRDCGYSEID